jgi:hypothetical protein
LRLVFEPVFAGDVRKREHLLSASITVGTANEIKQLFLSYQAPGVSFHQALKNEPWGAKTFIVSDPEERISSSLLARQPTELLRLEMRNCACTITTDKAFITHWHHLELDYGLQVGLTIGLNRSWS